MKIIALIDGAGPAYHRIYTPLANMQGVDVEYPTTLTEERCEQGFDVLVFNRLPPKQKLSEILQWHHKYGFKMVVDMDDHWELDPHHILYDHYRETHFSTYILCAITEADAITVTHERLAEAIAPYNRNVWVLPNAIPQDFDQFKLQTLPSDTCRLFWAGGITHEKDIAILRGPLRRVYSDASLREKIMMVLGGYNSHNKEWDAIVSSYTNGLRLRGHIMEGRPVAKYYGMYEFADICLVPLLDTRFNRYKSNLKILEAANIGVPVIVSAVHPYLGLPEELVNYVKTQQDWYKYIRHLVNDPEYRKAQGKALQDYCREVYHFERINQARKQLFESLCTATI